MNLVFDFELLNVQAKRVGHNLFKELQSGPDGGTCSNCRTSRVGHGVPKDGFESKYAVVEVVGQVVVPKRIEVPSEIVEVLKIGAVDDVVKKRS